MELYHFKVKNTVEYNYFNCYFFELNFMEKRRKEYKNKIGIAHIEC